MIFSHKEKPRLTLRRNDPENPLSSYSSFAFELDGYEWPSVEHYYNAMKYGDEKYAEKIRNAPLAADAEKLGKSRWHKKRKDWKKVKLTVMTRGTYIKCRTHPEVAKMLLDTGDIEITEVSLYDYFWGLGRDQRGDNAFGKMLMDIRDKLREEQE